jgi:hypothetical protein
LSAARTFRSSGPALVAATSRAKAAYTPLKRHGRGRPGLIPAPADRVSYSGPDSTPCIGWPCSAAGASRHAFLLTAASDAELETAVAHQA